MKKSIYDVIKCPYCGSDDFYIFGTDEIEFEDDGSGHYRPECTCEDCHKSYRTYIKFNYEVKE